MEDAVGLIVDADPADRAVVQEVWQRAGVQALGAATWHEALESFRRTSIRVLMIDVDAPGVSIPEALGDADRLWPAAARIVLGVGGRPGELVSLLRGGVQEVVPKPLDEGLLRVATERALAYNRVRSEVEALRERLRAREGYERIVGTSPSMERLRDRVRRLAGREGSILFTGERGVGKELAARAVHDMSIRSDRPFGVLSCSAFREDALERELFGNAASEAMPGDGGALETRDGGVLFLDEIGALSLRLQEALAAALESGTVVRGPRAGTPVDVRLISASPTDLAQAVAEGRFREDLHARISGTTIHVEPLRDRPEDIPVLARHFVRTICQVNDLPTIDLTADTLSLLEEYEWPGNARELRNAMEHATILASDGIIRPRDLPDRIRESRREAEHAGHVGAESVFREAKRVVVEEFERRYLAELLERNRGNVTAAAQQAGMLRSALQRLLRKHSLRSADFRRPRRGTEASDEA